MALSSKFTANERLIRKRLAARLRQRRCRERKREAVLAQRKQERKVASKSTTCTATSPPLSDAIEETKATNNNVILSSNSPVMMDDDNHLERETAVQPSYHHPSAVPRMYHSHPHLHPPRMPPGSSYPPPPPSHRMMGPCPSVPFEHPHYARLPYRMHSHVPPPPTHPFAPRGSYHMPSFPPHPHPYGHAPPLSHHHASLMTTEKSGVTAAACSSPRQPPAVSRSNSEVSGEGGAHHSHPNCNSSVSSAGSPMAATITSTTTNPSEASITTTPAVTKRDVEKVVLPSKEQAAIDAMLSLGAGAPSDSEETDSTASLSDDGTGSSCHSPAASSSEASEVLVSAPQRSRMPHKVPPKSVKFPSSSSSSLTFAPYPPVAPPPHYPMPYHHYHHHHRPHQNFPGVTRHAV